MYPEEFVTLWFLHVWENQATFNIDNLINAHKVKIQQNYIHWWDGNTKTFSKLNFLNKFKTIFFFRKVPKARELSLRTGAQTMLYLSLVTWI